MLRHQARSLRSSAFLGMEKSVRSKGKPLGYPLYLRKTTDVLWPPKPNVLLIATFTVRCCALLNVRFNLGSISDRP